MKNRTKKLLSAVLLNIYLYSSAQAGLTKRIDSIISQSSQKNVQFSIHIINARTGQTVYSRNATKALIPASNIKLITTAAALHYLGPDYQYKTKVGLCGDTLVIIGSGDPLLGDKATDTKYGRKQNWIFQNIIDILKQNGIKTMNDIIIDTSIFDDQRVHQNWPKKELNRWYACEVSGLNYNGNCIEVTAKNIAGKVSLYIEPKTNFVELINQVKPTSKANSSVGSHRTSKPNVIIINGNCNNQAGPFDVAIERPAAFFGFLLAENLSYAGIKAQGQLIEKSLDNYPDFRLIAQYSSPITDCLARCNKDSFGLAAEALLKTIAANSNPDGKNGSWVGGQNLISQYLLNLGLDQSQFHIDDGSGLSRKNKLSASAITKTLFDVYKGKNWKLYQDSLAAGGVDGTISRYFKEQKYKGKILGKTGYIYRVKSFSGVCLTGKDDFLFSILANNTNGQTRQVINDIAKAIIDNADM